MREVSAAMPYHANAIKIGGGGGGGGSSSTCNGCGVSSNKVRRTPITFLIEECYTKRLHTWHITRHRSCIVNLCIACSSSSNTHLRITRSGSSSSHTLVGIEPPPAPSPPSNVEQKQRVNQLQRIACDKLHVTDDGV